MKNLLTLTLLLLPYHATIGATVTITSTDQFPMFVPEGARAPGGALLLNSVVPIPPLELQFGVEGAWHDIQKIVVLSNHKLLGEVWLADAHPLILTNTHTTVTTNRPATPPAPQPVYDPNTGVTLIPVTEPFFLDLFGTNRTGTAFATNMVSQVITQQMQLNIALPVSFPAGTTPLQFFLDVKKNIATNGSVVKLELRGVGRGTNTFLQGRLPLATTHTLVKNPRIGSGDLESVMLSHTIRRGTNNILGAMLIKGGTEPRELTLPVEFQFLNFHWAGIEDLAAVVNGQIFGPGTSTTAGTHPFRSDILVLREIFRNIPVPAGDTRVYFTGTVHGEIRSRAGMLSATSLASEWFIRGLYSNVLIAPHAESGAVSSTVIVAR